MRHWEMQQCRNYGMNPVNLSDGFFLCPVRLPITKPVRSIQTGLPHQCIKPNHCQKKEPLGAVAASLLFFRHFISPAGDTSPKVAKVGTLTCCDSFDTSVGPDSTISIEITDWGSTTLQIAQSCMWKSFKRVYRKKLPDFWPLFITEHKRGRKEC